MIPTCSSETFCSHSSWAAISAIWEEKDDILKASSSMSSANKPIGVSVVTTDLPRKVTSLNIDKTWHRDAAAKFQRSSKLTQWACLAAKHWIHLSAILTKRAWRFFKNFIFKTLVRFCSLNSIILCLCLFLRSLLSELNYCSVQMTCEFNSRSRAPARNVLCIIETAICGTQLWASQHAEMGDSLCSVLSMIRIPFVSFFFHPLVNTVHYSNTENGQKWTDLSEQCESDCMFQLLYIGFLSCILNFVHKIGTM